MATSSAEAADQHPGALSPSLDVTVLVDHQHASASSVPESSSSSEQGNATAAVHQKKKNTARLLWVVPNILKLNRRNKISSKPFVVPLVSDPSTGLGPFSFRFILLRGLEKAASEEEDPVGLFLEYLPAGSDPSQKPSSDSQSGSTSEGTAPHPQRHPENTGVKAAILRLPGLAAAVGDGTGEQSKPMTPLPTVNVTHKFHPKETTVAFRTFIPSTVLRDRTVVNEEGTMQIEVDLEFGLPTLSETVTQATEKISNSFWRGFSALSTSLVQLKNTVTETVANTFHHDVQVREEAPPSLPWETVPPKWRGREDKWIDMCTVVLPNNEFTFLAGPERGLTSDEQVIMAQMGLSHKAIMSANSMFDFDRDVHEGLLSLEILRVQRYQLVPKLVSDVHFWRNYFWKIAALSICSTGDQVQLLLSILNAPVEVKSSLIAPRRQSPAAEGVTASGTASSSQHLAAPGSSSASVDYEKEVAAAVREAMDTVGFIRDLLSDEEVDQAMLETAVKSCQHQKKCVSDLQRKLDTTVRLVSADSEKPWAAPLAATLAELDAAIALSNKVGGSAAPPTSSSKPGSPTQPRPQTEGQKSAEPVPAPKSPQHSPPPPQVQASNATSAADDGAATGSAHSSFVEVTHSSDGHQSPSPTRQGSSSASSVSAETHPPVRVAPPTEGVAPAAEGAPSSVALEQASPPPKPVSHASEHPVTGHSDTATAVKRRDSFDELGFDDFPTLDDNATPPRGTNATANAAPVVPSSNTKSLQPVEDAGRSASRKSSSADFAKMPWEEDDE